MKVMNTCQQRGWAHPSWVSEAVPGSDGKAWRGRVGLADCPAVGEVVGSVAGTKKAAKQRAAVAWLEAFNERDGDGRVKEGTSGEPPKQHRLIQADVVDLQLAAAATGSAAGSQAQPVPVAVEQPLLSDGGADDGYASDE
jgi:hypothetical protein